MRLLVVFLAVAVGASQAAHTQDNEYEGPTGFRWGPALQQSFFFLAIEHGGRMAQAKTRREFRGPFFKDYFRSVRSLGGWDDGDSFFTNYIAHPMQGAVAGYIQIQNDPGGVTQQFSRSRDYWKSRMKALGWSAAYSTQFELGLLSEAALGNVGRRPGTMGYVDLVMTPIPGVALIVAEDAVDRYLVQRLESRLSSPNWKRVGRVALNPQRSFANILRLRRPWHRDTRLLSDSGFGE